MSYSYTCYSIYLIFYAVCHIIYLSSTCVYIILYLYINEMMMMMVQKNNNKKFKEGIYAVLKIKKKFKKLNLYKKNKK